MTQQIINVGTVANDGTGEALRTAFNAVNDNFTEVYTAGPVGSNVVIANNTISINGTNGNLILQGNGIGNVVTNSSMRPEIDAVFDLGHPSYRYDTFYARYIAGNVIIQTDNYQYANGAPFIGGGGSGNGTAIANGTSNVSIVSANANVTIGVAGTSNVAVFSTAGANVKGSVIATGNITGGNIVGGNIYVGNTILTRTLTVGTRTTPVTVPLATNNSFNVGQRTGGNVVVYTT